MDNNPSVIFPDTMVGLKIVSRRTGEQVFSLEENGRYEYNEATLAQRLYFLKGLLGSEDFQQAVQRIVTMPNTKWHAELRTVDVRQSRRLGLHESVTGASYLYMHGEGEYRGGGSLFRIVSEGPRVFSKETLLEKGYPGSASQPYYIVYDIKPLPEGDPLNNYDWDLSEVEGVGERRASAIPRKGVPLSGFMRGAKPKSPTVSPTT